MVSGTQIRQFLFCKNVQIFCFNSHIQNKMPIPLTSDELWHSFRRDLVLNGNEESKRGRFRKRNLKHAKECLIKQRRGFERGVCCWKRRSGCSRNPAVSAARYESGFREWGEQGQHWRGPHSHGGFSKMIVCEQGNNANGLTYDIFRILRRPLKES